MERTKYSVAKDRLGSAPFVSMVQAAHLRNGNDTTVLRSIDGSRLRGVFRQVQMRARILVVMKIASQSPPQRRLVPHNSENRISILDQLLWRFPRKRFSNLLRRPLFARMPRRVAVHHTAAVMRQDHEDKQHPEGRSRHSEEIH